MSKISIKTSKVIWSNSGGQCAICKQKLTKKVDNKHLVLGQECHIRSPKKNGPRFSKTYLGSKLNEPENLILLCRDHHKEIDDFPQKYPVEYLQKIKKDHEESMQNNYNNKYPKIRIIKKSKYLEATLISSGLQLIDFASSAMSYNYKFDETDDDKTYELIKDFLSYVEDFDIISDISTSNKLDMARELKQLIIDLQSVGYFVFAGIAKDIITGGTSEDDEWKTVYFALTTNKDIKYIAR